MLLVRQYNDNEHQIKNLECRLVDREFLCVIEVKHNMDAELVASYVFSPYYCEFIRNEYFKYLLQILQDVLSRFAFCNDQVSSRYSCVYFELMRISTYVSITPCCECFGFGSDDPFSRLRYNYHRYTTSKWSFIFDFVQ